MDRAQPASSGFVIPRHQRVKPAAPDTALPPDGRNPRLGLVVVIVIAALFYAGLALLIRKFF